MRKTDIPIEEGHIVVENIGPVHGRFDIDLTKGAGLYVLRGSKGSGKSTTLTCLDLLAGHDAEITLHDGASSGVVAGFGVVAPVTMSRKSDGSALVRKKGSFSIDTINSEKFGISDITDPGIKDPAKADAHRIKAIARLTQSSCNADDYYAIVGGKGEFIESVWDEDINTDDPVLLASRFKAAFDAAAREAEKNADREEGQAIAYQKSIEGIDTEAVCDHRILSQKVDAAVSELSRLKTNREHAERHSQQVIAAKEKIRQLESEETKSVEEIDGDIMFAESRIAELKAIIAESLAEVSKVETTLKNAKQQRIQVAQRRNTIDDLTAIINSATCLPPTKDDLADAENRVKKAYADLENGVRVRDAITKQESASVCLAASQRHRGKSEKMRDAASKVFGVLLKSVNVDGIYVEQVNGYPRLLVDHPKRGKTLFAELSDGEKVRTTIDILLPVIGSPGIFPIPQRLFQDLPKLDLVEIDLYAKSKGVFVIGAQVDDGSLRVEKW